MNDSFKAKLSAANTIALWLLLLVVGGWLIFKPDANLSKDTVEKLATAVDKISVASENMTATANAQREWTDSLQKSAEINARKRESDYDDLYNKYGYDTKAGPHSLSEFYGDGVQQPEDNGRSELRGNQNPAPKAGNVQKPVSKPQGQSH